MEAAFGEGYGSLGRSSASTRLTSFGKKLCLFEKLKSSSPYLLPITLHVEKGQ
jgi:hypothetical protein